MEDLGANETRAFSDTPAQPMGIYTHQPLQPGPRFRLLTLHPADSRDAPLHCTLEEKPLDGTCEYDALSYAWDAQLPERDMICDGSVLRITVNCEAALRGLRGRTTEHTLWIDSVCINQAVDEERSHQVSLMKNIYSQARTVIVWLREGNEISNLALEYLNCCFLRHAATIRTTGEVHITNEDFEAFENFQTKSDETYRRHHPEAKLKVQRNAIEDITGRSWFERAWTVQEAALARRCLILCGAAAIDWEAFEASLTKILQLVLSKQQYHCWIGPALSHIYARRAFSSKQEADLRDLLTTYRTLRASDKRDKVFSQYWLCQTIDPSYPSPDYSKSLPEIYGEATALAIKSTKSLASLEMCFNIDDSFPRASWILDWSRNIYHPFQDATASRDSTARFEFSADEKLLQLSGINVDKVQRRGTPLCNITPKEFHDFNDSINDRVSNIVKLIRILKEWCEIAGPISPLDPLDPPSKAILRLLKASIRRSPTNIRWPSDQMQRVFLDSLQGTQSYRRELLKEFRHGLSRRAPPEFSPYLNIEELVIFLYLQSTELQSLLTSMAALGRVSFTFFVSENGTCGFAPPFIEVGDSITLFSGVRYPMIIRPVGDNQYRLIGPAWVEGMMEGEYWTKPEEKMKEFVIC